MDQPNTGTDKPCPTGKYKLNDRVPTPYGPGTIAAFESFDLDGMAINSTEEPKQISRYGVRLDYPKNWAGYREGDDLTLLPYFWEKELKLLKENTEQ